ncbi:dihydrofolate reductase [Nocardioides sp. YIM 152315]|uniref:dihydrofolate reductase n=1 Tax=Nocardioides sp. YIM 152315 TaxID=3031760 RepID=UPI0023DC3EAA|nr:dihydrofolate reductase [Nocardioides sp. YIM 152315]MDF1605504.1 dihydrofolate reductase [Nocardioides sp. YIM 152315]
MLVAAVARNGVIGNGPEIPWRLPGEQAFFKSFTLGHTLVMGRTTHESIGRPLPGRTTIVLTRSPSWSAAGVLVAHSVEEALDLADTLPAGAQVMVAGGGEVYAAALPHADEQVLSLVDLEPEGDAFYPSYDPAEWLETARETHDGYDRVFLVRAADRL